MLSWQGKCEHLRRKELEVLALLASAEGKQVSRDNFIAVVWQGNDLVGDRGLSNTIVFVRKSLRDDDAAHPVIRTIPRRGYQLSVPVEQPVVSTTPAPIALVPGAMIAECPGWRLLRRLSESPTSDSWLAEPSEFGERESRLRLFRFCKSEADLQRLRREVTLLRYLRESLDAHRTLR
jgi:DNA-binding SARP family transcriptional activator